MALWAPTHGSGSATTTARSAPRCGIRAATAAPALPTSAPSSSMCSARCGTSALFCNASSGNLHVHVHGHVTWFYMSACDVAHLQAGAQLMLELCVAQLHAASAFVKSGTQQKSVHMPGIARGEIRVCASSQGKLERCHIVKCRWAPPPTGCTAAARRAR